MNILKKLSSARWLVLGPVAAAALVACGGGGGGSTLSGVAVDGYLQGATVFLDVNGDGELNEGEPTATTDDNGRYELDTSGVEGSLSGLKVVVMGGVDSDTGEEFGGYLTARVDTAASGQVVTPLTALVDAMVDEGLAEDVEAAREMIATALGLNPEDLTVDPLAVMDSKPGIYATEAALQRSIELLASANALPEEASDRAAQQRVIKALALAVKAQESHVSLGALMSAIHSHRNTAEAAELAEAVQESIETSLQDTDRERGRQNARGALRTLDQVRRRAQETGDYDLGRHAAEIDRQQGGNGRATAAVNRGKGNGKK